MTKKNPLARFDSYVVSLAFWGSGLIIAGAVIAGISYADPFEGGWFAFGIALAIAGAFVFTAFLVLYGIDLHSRAMRQAEKAAPERERV